MRRLAVICDMAEENWASMDLVAEKFLESLRQDHSGAIAAEMIRPPMKRRLTYTIDRLLNRFWDYPRRLRGLSGDFDFFHLCDHSYSQLVHVLPAERTGVVCQDLDTFRCLLEPALEPRSMAFRLMTRRILEGLQRAALVFYTTKEGRRQIEKYALVDPSRLVYAPNAVSPVFSPRTAGPEPAAAVAAAEAASPFLMHVGLGRPRKRLDVLLEVFAGLRRRRPNLRLLQVGAEWTSTQSAQIQRLGIAASVIQHPRKIGGPADGEEALAAIYRRAQLVLLTSEAEGFGLPVVEALACGRAVVASDIPVLRETGGEAAVYCQVADVPAWVETVDGLLADPNRAPSLEARLGQARRFSWASQTKAIIEAYRRLPGWGGQGN